MSKSLENVVVLLDLDTCSTAPGFFALYALTMRAAGAEIVICGRDKYTEQQGAKMGIGFSRAAVMPQGSFEVAKFTEARRLLASGKQVIWIDLAFGSWTGPGVNDTPGLIVLNWRAVAEKGVNAAATVANA